MKNRRDPTSSLRVGGLNEDDGLTLWPIQSYDANHVLDPSSLP